MGWKHSDPPLHESIGLWRVTLPQIRPVLVSSMFLAFISSFDELVVAMFLGGSNMTLPKKMFDNIPRHRSTIVAARPPGRAAPSSSWWSASAAAPAR
jgi:ABC-type glycerol-3-phosphate transport system permease component